MLTLKIVTDKTIMSENPEFEGVGVVLRPVNVSLRAGVELEVSKHRAKLYDLQLELEGVEPKLRQWVEANMNKQEGGDPFPSDYQFPDEALALARRIQDLNTDMTIVRVGYIIPAWIRASVKRVIGVKVEDRDATPEEFATCNYPNLLRELGDKILAEAYMGVEKQANFQSPTTSVEEDGGQSQSTNATNAEKTTGTGIEIVENIFQKVS